LAIPIPITKENIPKARLQSAEAEYCRNAILDSKKLFRPPNREKRPNHPQQEVEDSEPAIKGQLLVLIRRKKTVRIPHSNNTCDTSVLGTTAVHKREDVHT